MKHVCQYCWHPIDEHSSWCPYTEDRPYPGTMLGKLGLYKWPNGEETVVVILDQPDDDGDIGIALLSENRRVQPADVRPFPEDEET